MLIVNVLQALATCQVIHKALYIHGHLVEASQYSRPWAEWLSWLGSHPIHQKGCGFNSRSGHIPRLWVRCLVGASMGGNQSISLSHCCFSLSLPLKINFLKYPPVGIFLKSLVLASWAQWVECQWIE
uniref:Uncharacterized protein n=1 Tax=Pipistrellus kuhlii TaxID=59472 RepID=A0A7J7S3S1_PIPKU|nr:hypothetical protein mPipKuh1_010192 [Pipistrellus kuhlii]